MEAEVLLSETERTTASDLHVVLGKGEDQTVKSGVHPPGHCLVFCAFWL